MIKKLKVPLLLIMLSALGFQMLMLWFEGRHDTVDNHFMTQINTLRAENGRSLIARNSRADALASYIHDGYYDYFAVLDKMDTLGLGGQGQYFVYWELTLTSSVAEQINSMNAFEQGLFVRPEALYWGHHIDRDNYDYTLVLILANPLYRAVQPLVEEAERGAYE